MAVFEPPKAILSVGSGSGILPPFPSPHSDIRKCPHCGCVLIGEPAVSKEDLQDSGLADAWNTLATADIGARLEQAENAGQELTAEAIGEIAADAILAAIDNYEAGTAKQ